MTLLLGATSFNHWKALRYTIIRMLSYGIEVSTETFDENVGGSGGGLMRQPPQGAMSTPSSTSTSTSLAMLDRFVCYVGYVLYTYI